MSLTGPQFHQLEDALIRAFDESSLTQMVRLRLDQDLSAIAGGTDLSDIVLNLIAWAERTGRTDELIVGASAGSPDNPELKAFVTEYFESGAGHQPTGDSPITAGARPVRQLDTQGGAYVAGSVTTSGGDFVGRDKIVTIQQVHSGSDTQDQRNRRILLQAVKQFWIDGVLDHSLDHEAAIRLGIADRSSLVENRPWRVIPQQTNETARTLPPGMSIIDVFDQMGQRMLILGEPGAGKTTALLELARSLVERADEAPDLPSPVVFHLSSWIQRKAPLAEWLVNELGSRYSIPKKMAQAWIEHDKLLLLLDGLDEVQSEHRSACVEAINQFLQDHLVPLAVCSRLAEYEALSVRLKLRGAVVLQHLTAAQIDNYLNRAGPALSSVRTALQNDAELGELVKSPLMLSIMALAYQDVSPADLELRDIGLVRRQHLFDTYIQRMFVRREVELVYSPDKTLRWLQWLATKLARSGQTIFLIESIQPDWMSTSGWLGSAYPRIMLLAGPLYGLVVGCIYGLVVGLLGMFFWWFERSSVGLGPELSFDWESGVIGAGVGLLVGGMFLIADGPSGRFQNINPLERFATLKSRLLSDSYVAIVVGVFIGVLSGKNDGSLVGIRNGVTTGLMVMLFIGLKNRELVARRDQVAYSLIVALALTLCGGLAGIFLGSVLGTLLGSLFGHWTEGLSLGAFFGLLLGTYVILHLLFVESRGGMLQESPRAAVKLDIKTNTPNQAIILSLRYAILTSIVYALVVGFALLILWGLTARPDLAVDLALAGMFFAGLLGGLRGGGAIITKHCLLRVVLGLQGRVAWNYVRFLDYATSLIFLRKVGGGYIFAHRLIMEHFAALEEQDIERIIAFPGFPNTTNSRNAEGKR